MSGVRYSVYAVEKGGKFLKSDLRRFTPNPLAAIHFANYSRAVERATKVGGEVVKITMQHPGVWRDIGDAISTHLISVEHA